MNRPAFAEVQGRLGRCGVRLQLAPVVNNSFVLSRAGKGPSGCLTRASTAVFCYVAEFVSKVISGAPDKESLRGATKVEPVLPLLLQ